MWFCSLLQSQKMRTQRNPMSNSILRIAVLLATISATATAQTVRDNDLDKSIVQIVVRLPNDQFVTKGTGFVVSDDGLIATAFHVYAGAIKTASDARGGTLGVRRASRDSGKWVSHPAAIAGAEPKFDLVILRVEVSDDWQEVGGLIPLRLSERTEITPPVSVRVVGYFGRDRYPLYLRCEIAGTGTVTLGKDRGIVEEFLLSGLLLPGHSGSPVIDDDGFVLGLVSSIVPVSLPFNRSQPQHSGLSKVVKVEHLKSILSSIGSK